MDPAILLGITSDSKLTFGNQVEYGQKSWVFVVAYWHVIKLIS